MNLLKTKVNLPKIKIFNFWKGNNRDRFLLFAIIFGVWVLIKTIEEFVPSKYLEKLPSDVSLTLVALTVLIMALHALYIFVAQNHRRRQNIQPSNNYKPSIDIFIAAHNEEKVIGATLEALLSLTYPQLKIYLINDRSTDSTKNIAENIANKNPKLQVINRNSDAAPGKSAALNDALKFSNSELICVLDADARIGDDFLQNIVQYLEDPQVGAVQAQKVISNPNHNFLTRCQYHEYAMDTYLQMGRDSIRGAVELRGNGQIVRRQAIEELGGWNEETLTDDLDLSTCLHVSGWDIRFSPENKVYEEAVANLDGFIKQRRRWAEGSMRRYLNYAFQLMKPGNLSLVQIFDTFVFLSEFSIPLWLAFDFVYEIIRLASGRETYFSFLMLLSIGLGIVLFFSQFNGLRIYHKQKILTAFWNSLLSLAYILSTWTFVIIVTYRKILFSRSMGTWTRTEHGT